MPLAGVSPPAAHGPPLPPVAALLTGSTAVAPCCELDHAFMCAACLLQVTCALCRPGDPANEWLCTLVYIGAGVCFASAFFLALMLVSWQCWQCSFCGRCYGIMPMTGACDGPA